MENKNINPKKLKEHQIKEMKKEIKSYSNKLFISLILFILSLASMFHVKNMWEFSTILLISIICLGLVIRNYNFRKLSFNSYKLMLYFFDKNDI